MKDVKIEHFRNLVAVAFADGHMEDSEKEFLEERAEELGLPAAEVNSIIKDAHNLEFRVPDDMDEREEQLSDVVFMSMVDGDIEQKEYDLCLNIAERLGLRKADLDEVIALVKRLWKTD